MSLVDSLMFWFVPQRVYRHVNVPRRRNCEHPVRDKKQHRNEGQPRWYQNPHTHGSNYLYTLKVYKALPESCYLIVSSLLELHRMLSNLCDKIVVLDDNHHYSSTQEWANPNAVRSSLCQACGGWMGWGDSGTTLGLTFQSKRGLLKVCSV